MGGEEKGGETKGSLVDVLEGVMWGGSRGWATMMRIAAARLGCWWIEGGERRDDGRDGVGSRGKREDGSSCWVCWRRASMEARRESVLAGAGARVLTRTPRAARLRETAAIFATITPASAPAAACCTTNGSSVSAGGLAGLPSMHTCATIDASARWTAGLPAVTFGGVVLGAELEEIAVGERPRLAGTHRQSVHKGAVARAKVLHNNLHTSAAAALATGLPGPFLS